MRWLWIDRFEAFAPGESARAIKNLTRGEDFFADHFPECPVMPATLIIEGMAQTAGILVGAVRGFREKVVLAKITRAVFVDEAVPGDQLRFDAAIVGGAGGVKDQGAAATGKVFRNGQPLAEIDLMFAHLDHSGNRVGPSEGNFVFDAQFLQLVGGYGLDDLKP